MLSIWKYTVPQDLEASGEHPRVGVRMKMSLPLKSKILSFEFQKPSPQQAGVPVIWALVNPEEQLKDDRQLIFLFTGGNTNEFIDSAMFIGTVTDDFGLVWHLFEI